MNVTVNLQMMIHQMRKRQAFQRTDTCISLKLRRRRWLMSAQGWSAATTLGRESKNFRLNPERVPWPANPFRVLASLEPWADISERLRRNLLKKSN